MSMPFNITTSLVILAGVALPYLTPSQNLSVIDVQIPVPPNISTFLSSFSAILFQPNPLSGLLIAVGILLYSRIAFTLMATGLLTAYYLHNISGLDINIINQKYLGFNYMFSALAIGGVFTIPSTGSLFLGLMASSVTVIIIAACDTLLPSPLSPLALPFNITVYLFLYALKLRASPSLNVNLAVEGSMSPEENLRRHHKALKQWRRSLTIALPFHGRWKVIQGIDGQFTHKEEWCFAYDFQAVDFTGKTYKSDGSTLDDYYSFGLPVIAPADGKIHSIKNNVPDNQIGRVNTKDNWGNYIIIEHAQNYYSCLAHLKQGSIKLMPGQEVKKGQIIAACGNSGRSPYPHIHIQFQALPQIGSPTISFEFSHFVIINEYQTFVPQGIIMENSIVQNLMPSVDYEEFFPYSLNRVWTYKTIQHKKERLEYWHMDLDLYGNAILKSSPKTTKLYFQFSDGALNVKAIEGDTTTGLALMGSLLTEVPLASGEEEIIWTTFDTVDYRIHTILKAVMDVFSLLGFNLTARRSYTARNSNDEITLKIKSSLQLKIPFFTIPLRDLPDAEIIFKRNMGLKILKTGARALEIQRAS